MRFCHFRFESNRKICRIYKMTREEVLGFLPQRENIYNARLPHASDLDKDSDAYLKEIKHNLSQTVLNNDISTGDRASCTVIVLHDIEATIFINLLA